MQDILLYEVSKNWREDAATWNARTASVNWSILGGDYYATLLGSTGVSDVVALEGQWLTFDVPVSVIEGWLTDPTSNNGFFLRPEEDEGGGRAGDLTAKDSIEFASSEHGSANLRPKLEINYSGPGGNIPPLLEVQMSEDGAINLGTDVDITAMASDIDGSLSSVQFFDNGALIADFTTPPYQHTWRANPMGGHLFEAVATDNSGTSVTNLIEIAVKWLEQNPFFTNNLDDAAGWSFEGQWEFGQPSHGATSGHTGNNAICTDLDSYYMFNNPVTHYATSPAMDCSNRTGVTLSLWRILKTSDPVCIEASADDGNTWQTVWAYSGTQNSGEHDSNWTLMSVDISAVADNESQVKLRFGLGPTDSSHTGSGFLIDDIVLLDSPTNGLYDIDTDGLEDTWELVDQGSLTSLTGTVRVTYQDPEFIVTEGSTKTADVALNGRPLNTVTVQVARVSGDSDLSVSPSELIYTTSNWSNVQTVTIAAAQDADALDSLATIQFTAPNFLGDSFTAQEYDDDRDRTPVVGNDPGATSVSATSAELTGTLSNGFETATWICWGDTDAGTVSPNDWDNAVAMGNIRDGQQFSTTVSGLKTNAVYWYRCFVSNATGVGCSDATSFSGTSVFISDKYKEFYVGVNFVGTAGAGGTLDPEDLAGYVAQTNWNNMCASSQNDTLNTIMDSEGNVIAGMSVDTSIGAWDSRETSTATNEWGPHTNLFEGFLGDNESAWAPRVAVTGIPFDTYDVYVYLNSENGGKGAVRLNGGGTEYYAQMGNNPLFTGYTVSEETSSATGTYNTIVFSNVTGNMLDIDMLRSGSKIGVSGIQICGMRATPTIKNLAPTAISTSQATVGAALSAEGENYDVYVHYGTADGGTNSWTSNEIVGSFADTTTNISHTLSGLLDGTTYYYTFRASGNSGTVWASPSWSFTTLPVIDVGPVTTNHSIPYSWLNSFNPAWTNDAENSITNDHDGDGYATWEEYWCGTDPSDSDSRLKIDKIYMQSGSLRIEWQHVIPVGTLPPIAIHKSSDLQNWEHAGQKTPGNGNNFWLGNPSQLLFYRLAVTNTP
ncbi:hypothetical protein BVX97_04515 [bacterium E08(2017)]|nr:hypothetical protein BVX97_04515 [bacterium E08(2017)]